MREAKAAVLAALILVTTFAHASTDDSVLTEARQRARRAAQLYDMGKYAEAAVEYEAAFHLSDNPELLFNLGQSHRFAHHDAEALAAYRGFLRRVPAFAGRSEVQTQIAKLEAQIAKAEEARRSLADAETRAEEERKQILQAKADADARVAAERERQANVVAVAPTPRTPVYKRWWPWTIVGVGVGVIAGLGVGLGLTLGASRRGTVVDPVNVQ